MTEELLIEKLNTERKREALDFQQIFVYVVKSEIVKVFKDKNIFFKEELKLRESNNIKEKDYGIEIVTDNLSIFDIVDILNEKKNSLSIKIGKVSTKGNKIFFISSLGVHKAVFTIALENRDKIIYTERRTVFDFVSEKEIEYNIFQSEEMAVLLIIDILKKMEFCNDMDSYLKLYNLLKEVALDGRKIMSILEEKTENDERLVGKSLELKFNQFKEFRNNKYLKQNWKRHIRKIKEEKKSWEEVYDLILSFVTPIIQNRIENNIFIDSWMPELGRFLD